MLILHSALIVVAPIFSTWSKKFTFFSHVASFCVYVVRKIRRKFDFIQERFLDIHLLRSFAQPEAWLLCTWRVLEKVNYGGRLSHRSISNNSVMLSVVHDQLNKQCNWEKAAYGFSLSCHSGDGSSALYSDIFITNSSHLESSPYAFHT